MEQPRTGPGHPGAAEQERSGTATASAPPPDLAGYRRAVDEVVRYLHGGAAPGPAAAPVLDRAAGIPELRAVLDRVPGGADVALERIARQLAGFLPNPRSNAATPATLLRIGLLQQIDVAWWGSVTPFADDDAVRRSPQLTALAPLRRQRRLAFRYRIGTTALPGRARNYAVRRWAPDHEPRSSGLSYPLARPAMVSLLNEVAGRFAAAARPWRGTMWVNCIVRSTAVQQRLQQLGYSALLPSAHCTGHAADVEMAWLRRHGVAPALEDVLTAYRDEGVLNVIDEGQAWHVCLAPAHAGRYASAAPAAPGTA
ncbi:hypothetical protein JD79_03238 [Geodermatophilus normandii]|uniref:Uncharacterized protein n=1 Tax=Geodermatophilus normandii TaxID=1137989 RepID=A0A317QQU5_9ACTN|nr:hypothetical protein [Geodermatophilus normandii]PWW24060.1 hypothetical protein JD79_03238 [Geodermatophilus normandii]